MTKNKQKNNKVVSLLENPNMETQVKNVSWRGVLRVSIISLLLILLVFGYVVKFSVNSFPQIFKTKFTGTFDASSFYNAQNGDLIIVEEYTNITDIKEKDIVCYATNLGKGSGEIVSIQSGIVEINTAENTIKRLTINSIEGKQIKTIPILGFIVEFMGSYYGIIIFNIILIAYVAYITFSRVNFENSERGLLLYQRFRLNQKENKEKNRLLKKVKDLEDITYVIVSMLEGKFETNKQKFLEFNKDIKLSLKEKYKYVLRSVHEAYLTNEDLTREERKQITSVVELMCVCKDMDNDIEYMVVDLLLKTNLVDFDTENFSKEAVGFLNSNLDDDDLINFGSIIYILLYKNKKIKDDNIKKLVDVFLQKCQSLPDDEREIAKNTAQTIKNLIK